MKLGPSYLFRLAASLGWLLAWVAPGAAATIPPQPPRTLVLAGQEEAFRAYVTQGEGAAAFARIKADFDREWIDYPFPAEPLTYGNPSSSQRGQAAADQWRAAQDVCGRVSGIAEAATLLWRVTGEEKYLAKAKTFLLAEAEWSLDASGWKKGPGRGATSILYNDEAHFRLWRKLPLVYDQIRTQLTAAERAKLLAHYRARGAQSLQFIQKARTGDLRYNSLAVEPSSHPVRFMPMTALTGLALWDDLPEAREWWTYTYRFYRDQFPPWGGDDGGWAEGPAYWRGNIEHAAFQDALLAIGDPSAYRSAFWRNHGYFPVYVIQPYLASGFGDFSNAGRFNLEPVVAEYLTHLSRVTQDGYLLSFARLCTDDRPSPEEKGLRGLDRIYPTSVEFLVRNFIAAALPVPKPQPLSALPAERHFKDIDWVSLHSALGRPDDDIHLTFVSSPYGSFSHSHAHQNAFVLNAFGQNLAIASGYREFHNSPHHDKWTRQTVSKNALLIDGVGQKPQDKNATGDITRFEVSPRGVWTTGDATVAYQANQPKGYVERVTRDLVFVDRRYVVLRDVVKLAKPGRVSFLLHGERPLEWAPASQTALIRAPKATLTARLIPADGAPWTAKVTTGFPVPVDPKYVRGTAANYSSSAPWSDQGHFTADSPKPAREHILYTVLWPEQGSQPAVLETRLNGNALVIRRPDGKTDTVALTDDSLTIK